MQYTTRSRNRQWANDERHGRWVFTIVMPESLIEASELVVALHRPFKIASAELAQCSTVVLRACWNGIDALGEVAPFFRYADSAQSVIAEVSAAAIDLQGGPFALRSLVAGLPRAARCGVDVLLHDLLGKALDQPLWRLFGLEGLNWPATSRTIGIDTTEAMLKIGMELRDTPILKFKVGTGNEYELLAALRSFYSGTIWLDANEGWEPEQAAEVLTSLERFDVELCEQPIRAGQPAAMRWVREHTRIPIVADEDSVVSTDLPALIGCVDGVNVKLAKCGGLLAAIEMIATARALGFKVMLGSMVETAILTTAAAQIAPLVDWADIDAPLMLRDSPFTGVTYANGILSLPTTPGLGITTSAVPVTAKSTSATMPS